MAALSPTEFEQAMTLLSAEVGFDRLKERLVRVGAFSSKRNLGTVKALADRLYVLTGGLRRETAASYGFHSVWAEAFAGRLSEEDEKTLTEAAERINACLDSAQRVQPENAATLDGELMTYHGVLAKAVGDDVARLDMVIKAVPAVAERIRSWPDSAPGTAPEGTVTEENRSDPDEARQGSPGSTGESD
jgi:hypothetical protein